MKSITQKLVELKSEQLIQDVSSNCIRVKTGQLVRLYFCEGKLVQIERPDFAHMQGKTYASVEAEFDAMFGIAA